MVYMCGCSQTSSYPYIYSLEWWHFRALISVGYGPYGATGWGLGQRPDSDSELPRLEYASAAVRNMLFSILVINVVGVKVMISKIDYLCSLCKQIRVLHMIFANEMTTTRDVYFHFPSFTDLPSPYIPYPNPTVDNNHDSGICHQTHAVLQEEVV